MKKLFILMLCAMMVFLSACGGNASTDDPILNGSDGPLSEEPTEEPTEEATEAPTEEATGAPTAEISYTAEVLTYTMWEETPGGGSPVLEYYKATNKTSDATVVIFPGGGYEVRSEYEGKGYAEYFNSIGMDAFVCQYRVKPYYFPLPLLDARRAVRFVRANAEEFGIDPDKIAAMGSSAGGHLAALLSTYTESIDYEGADEIDLLDYMPNATILCYPVIHEPDEMNISHLGSYKALFGKERNDYASLAPDRLVTDSTPPAFIWHTSDDSTVSVINSYLYATALAQHGIEHEMHIFPGGGHGLGLATEKNEHVAQWSGLMKNWLCEIDWLAE